ncbi:unnamed protein product [Meganyctiphanes norvegica]|uniref:Uncharacterized protein n=1 Tax=Meganyctiphanes norvegica TaxID=48144 RepID=A0AAV2PUB7_MEGNR
MASALKISFKLFLVKLILIGTDSSVSSPNWTLEHSIILQDDNITYCPDSYDMFPCSCGGSYGRIYITCYGIVDGHVLDRILSLPYPYSNMTQLDVYSSVVGDLNSTFLYDNTFETISLVSSGITSIGEGAFDHCQSMLRHLSLGGNPLGTFPFDQLPQFHQLEALGLGSTKLSDISGLVDLPPMFNMDDLQLSSNKLTHLPDNVFFSVPHLGFLNLAYNSLTSLPPGVFLPLVKLQMLYLNNNDIHHLPMGSFWFSTPILRVVDFRYNKLEQVDPDVFSGIDHGTQFDFSFNQLGNKFPFEVYGPLVHTVSDYHGGYIDIIGTGNRPECDCGVAWFVTDQSYLDHVLVSRCANRTLITKLNKEVLLEECINNSTATHTLW